MDLGIIKTVVKKYPAGTISAAIVVLMIGAWFFRNSALTEMKEALERNSAEAQRHVTNIAHSVQLEEQLKSLENANSLIGSRLVNPQDLAINLQYFYKLETETGIKLLDARPASSPTTAKAAASMKGGYKPVQYAVSLQGTYVRVLTFLRRLEQGSYYCRVISANCNLAQEEAAEKKDKDAAVILSLTVEILGKA